MISACNMEEPASIDPDAAPAPLGVASRSVRARNVPLIEGEFPLEATAAAGCVVPVPDIERGRMSFTITTEATR